MIDSDKTERVGTRVTPNERLAVVLMARRENLDVSEMIRVAIREAAEKRGFQKMGLVNLTPFREDANHADKS